MKKHTIVHVESVDLSKLEIDGYNTFDWGFSTLPAYPKEDRKVGNRGEPWDFSKLLIATYSNSDTELILSYKTYNEEAAYEADHWSARLLGGRGYIYRDRQTILDVRERGEDPFEWEEKYAEHRADGVVAINGRVYNYTLFGSED